MRKRARTAPMMAPATVMELDLSACDWPEAEQRHTVLVGNLVREWLDISSKASRWGNNHWGSVFMGRSILTISPAFWTSPLQHQKFSWTDGIRPSEGVQRRTTPGTTWTMGPHSCCTPALQSHGLGDSLDRWVSRDTTASMETCCSFCHCRVWSEFFPCETPAVPPSRSQQALLYSWNLSFLGELSLNGGGSARSMAGTRTPPSNFHPAFNYHSALRQSLFCILSWRGARVSGRTVCSEQHSLLPESQRVFFCPHRVSSHRAR